MSLTTFLFLPVLVVGKSFSVPLPDGYADVTAQIEKVRGIFELLMDAGEAEGRRNWMREHWKSVEADV